MAYRPSNVFYLPQPKENLTQQEIEQAMSLIYEALMTEQSVRIPWNLSHLSQEQWEMLDEALDELLLEQEQSLLH